MQESGQIRKRAVFRAFYPSELTVNLLIVKNSDVLKV